MGASWRGHRRGRDAATGSAPRARRGDRSGGQLDRASPGRNARTFRWNGRDHEHTEWFYLARLTKTDVRPAGLRPDESDNFVGYRWFSLEEIQLSGERIEPIQLLEVIADLSRQ
jgi:hypothetical protein